MKTMNSIAMMVAAAIGLGSTGLYAQSKVEANIPFDFTVKGKTMPAGRYQLARNLSAPDTIEISNVSGGRSVLVVTYKALTAQPGAEAPRIVFNQYGNRYFLSELWTSDGTERRVTPAKMEQELKASTTPKKAPRITVAAVDN